MARELHRRQAWQALAVAIVVTLAVQWVPALQLLGWPLMLGSTLAHELGHGFAALALGGRFESMALYADGSGVAAYRGAFGRADIALVAAAGLLGPPAAALGCFVAERSARASHAVLGLFAVLLAAVAVLWSDNVLTFAFCGILAGLLAIMALYAGAALSQMLCVFLGVQLALASFTRADYLFTAEAQTGQGAMLSDVGQIAAAFWLPYWLWGGVIALISLLLLGLGVWRFLAALR
jgi:hypothetical protein